MNFVGSINQKECAMRRNIMFVAALACAGLLGCTGLETDAIAPSDAGPEEDGGDEICADRIDNDGDDLIDEVPPCQVGPVDEDGDGFAAPPEGEECDEDDDVCDCDDLKSWVHPDAIEVCDAIDNNCNGEVDESCGCQEDEDCAEDRVCLNDSCILGCRRDSQCESNQECVEGQCQAVEQPACEGNLECADDHACTEDFCDPQEGCEHVAHDDRCPDGFECDRSNGCVSIGPIPECEVDDDCPSDGVACTFEDCRDNECASVPRDDRCGDNEVCDSVRGCVESAVCQSDLDCVDNIACTSDFCEGGECFHTERDDRCGEYEECRAGVGCFFTGECDGDGDCSDGLWCNGSERCIASECEPGARDCNDGNANTVDSCNEATDACDHVAVNVEVCDGADNDGDGLRDETFACVLGTTQACATGCGSTGSQSCVAGCVWSACTPPAEACNERDDDCDGAIDENDVCGVHRRVACSYTTEGQAVYDVVQFIGCYGTQEDGIIACDGPAVNPFTGLGTWGSPIPGVFGLCATNNASTVTCTVDVPVGMDLRINSEFYNVAGGDRPASPRHWGCQDEPNRDRDEDLGTFTCTVDGVATSFDDGDGVIEVREFREVAGDDGTGCGLQFDNM